VVIIQRYRWVFFDAGSYPASGKAASVLQFYIFIGLVTFLWGLSFPTMKIALGAMHPFTLLLLRSVISAATIFGLIFIRRGVSSPPKGRPEFWWNAILHNTMFILLYYGAAITTSGRASVFLYTQPLFYAALAVWLIPEERLGMRSVLGFVAAFSGIVVMFGEKLGAGGAGTLLGDVLVILAALVWGIQSFYLRQRLKGIDPFRIAAWTQLIAIPLFFVVAVVGRLELPDSSNWAAIVAVGYNGFVGTGLVMVLWVRLLAEFPPTRVSAFMFLTPVFGVFMSSLILFESLTGFMLAGAALVAAWIYFVNTDRRALSDTAAASRTVP
jgi:drug/metabolite transporter (DMT)-like permease